MLNFLKAVMRSQQATGNSGQHTCELVFKPKADILNICRDYQFVFSVLDELHVSHHALCSRYCFKSEL